MLSIPTTKLHTPELLVVASVAVIPALSSLRLCDSGQACAASKTKFSKDMPQYNRSAEVSRRVNTWPYKELEEILALAEARKRIRHHDRLSGITKAPKPPVMLSSLERESKFKSSSFYSHPDSVEATILPSSINLIVSN
jgi:hypothetical protein